MADVCELPRELFRSPVEPRRPQPGTISRHRALHDCRRLLYAVCTTAANLDQRRTLYAQNPAEARFLGPVDRHTSIGTQSYRALKLSFRRRTAEGLSLTGNYTLSHCVGNVTPAGQPQISSGFLKPNDPEFDRGNCEQNRTQVGNFIGRIPDAAVR